MPAQPEAAPKWPVVEGDYLVGDGSSPVALCTLADTDLPAELKAAGLLDKVAIVGPLATENLGIERMVRNVVSNPAIRFLVLCGRDSRGHHAGQAILALKDRGVDGSGRILGAKGPRPMLKNLSLEEIAAFRQNVAVLDEIDTKAPGRIEVVVRGCRAQPKGELAVLPPKVRQAKVIEAEPIRNRDFLHDPEGFFLVLLDRETRVIVCEHYTQEGTLNEVLKGKRANDIANTAIKRGLLSRLDHAAYLGRELAKAEAALAMDLPYTQDAPLGARTTG